MGDRDRTLWLDPGFGASGDMLLAALVGLGAPLAEITAGLETLNVDGWTIIESNVIRGSLTATRTEVKATETDTHRTWSAIDTLLATADLPDRVAEGARATFRSLGEAEAGIHGVTLDEVHFHEVGAVDALVDIVGVQLALHHLEVDRVVSGPVGIGHGSVTSAHGLLPIPAPATAALLRGLPVSGLDTPTETVTPTGAALLASVVDDWGPMPDGALLATSRGAGGRNPDTHPNILSAHLLSPSTAGVTTLGGSTVGAATVSEALLIQTNLDDVTGELVAHTIDRCLELGADDAWARPIVMKKGRPGVELTVLTDADRVENLRRAVLAETASLGLRIVAATKHAQPRRFASVTVDGREIAVKIGPHGAKPEFDDLVAAARSLSVPVAELAARVMAVHYSTATGPEADSSAIERSQ